LKKIMIIHHSGSIGGAGVSVYNTIISLKDDYEVVIYCPSKPSDFSEYLYEKGINVKTYDFPIGTIHNFSGGPPAYSPGFLKGIINISKYRGEWERILRTENPNLVIANSKTLAWTALLFRKMNIKSICYVRETRKKSLTNFWNNIQRSLLDKFEGVIFISRYDQKTESLRNAKTQVVPNFIDLESYKQNRSRNEICNSFDIGSDSFNILFVGGMLRIKGFDVAVKSMKYLKNSNVKLVVAGDPLFHYRQENTIYSKIYNFAKKRYENMINSFVEKEKLQNQIIKIGIQKKMVDVYSIADVLIFPANEPHQARPVFEAGALKIPVIMPDFPNTKEYVIHGDNGLIFQRKNPKSLAKSIKTLINDEKYRRKLGENNFEYTSKQHTKETSEKLLKDMIENILLN